MFSCIKYLSPRRGAARRPGRRQCLRNPRIFETAVIYYAKRGEARAYGPVLPQIEILDRSSAEPLRYEELLEGNEFLRSYPISMLHGSTVVAPLILAGIQFSHSFL